MDESWMNAPRTNYWTCWVRNLKEQIPYFPSRGRHTLIKNSKAVEEHKILRLTITWFSNLWNWFRESSHTLASMTLQIGLDHPMVPSKWSFPLLTVTGTIIKSLLLEFVSSSFGLLGNLAITAHIPGKIVSCICNLSIITNIFICIFPVIFYKIPQAIFLYKVSKCLKIILIVENTSNL